MKRLVNRIPATLLLIGLFATTALAQTSAQEIAANFRAQLSEVEVRQAEMQARRKLREICLWLPTEWRSAAAPTTVGHRKAEPRE